MMMPTTPPHTEADLLLRCRQIEGLTVNQLLQQVPIAIAREASRRKGAVGMLLERMLGAEAGNQAAPDFSHLGVELKTLPIGLDGKPIESTFITTIPLLTIHQQKWQTSTCFLKLKRVLWLPIEADSSLPLMHRRVGRAFLWSPTPEQELILEQDWVLLTNMITAGALDEISAHIGRYLQIRPKAAHGQVLTDSFDRVGNRMKTLPRGFYLRRRFTELLIPAK